MYATKQSMIDRFGEDKMIEVTDRADPPAGEISDAVLEAALNEASARIDASLGRRYKLPLPLVPAALVEPCQAIAFYILLRGHHRDTDRQAYEDAIAFLRDLSTGIAVLDVGGTEPPSAVAQVVAADTDRTFDRSKKWY